VYLLFVISFLAYLFVSHDEEGFYPKELENETFDDINNDIVELDDSSGSSDSIELKEKRLLEDDDNSSSYSDENDSLSEYTSKDVQSQTENVTIFSEEEYTTMKERSDKARSEAIFSLKEATK
jgi:hypothetical protein